MALTQRALKLSMSRQRLTVKRHPQVQDVTLGSCSNLKPIQCAGGATLQECAQTLVLSNVQVEPLLGLFWGMQEPEYTLF